MRIPVRGRPRASRYGRARGLALRAVHGACAVAGGSPGPGGSVKLAAMNAPRLPIALIAAVAANGVIGRDNRMPWHLPADLRYFKAATLGKPVVMGRKTWDSLGRPLPGRLNLVVSRQPGLALEGAETFGSLDAALARADRWAREQGAGEIMLIGGAQLYVEALPQAARLYLTRIALSPEGDAFFPGWTPADWQLVSRAEHPATAEAPGHAFEVWERRQDARKPRPVVS